MVKKDRIINELYIDTLKDISSSAVKWVTFLNTSSMNYKYIFSEQVLIYAQKPESIACASIDTWNRRLKRWVNKGSKGIALLTEKNGKTGITYVFDVSDTNSRNGKKVDIWSLDTKYENDIIESLNNKFGELVSIDDISNTIMSVTSNLLEDNLKQYIDNIIENKENSLLQEFSEDEIIAMTYQLLLYSISYSVLNRCGINAEAYIELEYFQNIRLFNNNKLLLALGTATNELSKLELTEIYNTLKKIRINEIRTFAKEKSSEYNVSNEGSEYNDRLQNGRGLSNPNIRDERRQGGSRREVFNDEIKSSENSQEHSISRNANEREISETSERDTRRINDDVGQTDEGINGEISNNRRNENERPIEVGSRDEQYQETSRSDNSTGINSSISIFPSVEEQKEMVGVNDNTSTFFVSKEDIDRCILRGSNFENGKFRIYNEIMSNLSTQEIISFMKDEYGIGGGTLDLEKGLNHLHDSKGIRISKNGIKEEYFMNWNVIIDEIKKHIDNDRWFNSDEKEKYQKWLKDKEQEDKNKTKDILVDSFEESTEKIYKYRLGAKIYIGLEEFEILEINNDFVKLYDYKYPLFNKEIQREEFDIKVKENPANDHLIIEETISEFIDENDKIDDLIDNEDIVEYREKSFEIVNQKQDRKESNVIVPTISDGERISYKITNNELGVATPKERFKNNIEAIKLLKKLEEENRLAVKEEQSILSNYVGWGGLSEAFDINNASWSNEYLILKNVLDEYEYTLARESTLTAFYTPPVVIKSMYKAIENMGFETGNILEPSCGTGNFLGMLPEKLSNSKMYGVELDSISGRIARQLYQKSSITIDGFEKVDLPNSFFDIAISNVPFGDFKLLDKKYDKHKFLIHDYFFAKTLDKVRPGGIVAFITSKGTLDKENPSFRKYLSQRADLLGAIRLPDNTFKSSAGTEVTSDIIFLQKRESVIDKEQDWVHLDKDENGIRMNKYFVDNPNMIIGKMQMTSTRFGMDSVCKLEDNNLEELLAEAITNIHAEINDYELEDIDQEETIIEADLNVRNFSYTIKDNKIYYRENSRMHLLELPSVTENRVRNLIDIRDTVRTLIEYQLEDYSDQDIKRLQHELNYKYDTFTKKYGLINSRGNKIAFDNDDSYYLLCSLEILDENQNLKRKADMFHKRTIKPHIEIEKVDTSEEALILSISEKARIDFEYMTNLTGKDKEEIIADLKGIIFKIPDSLNEYVTADEYLSGNVREKLKIAKLYANNDEEYKINVEKLEKIIPVDLEANDINVRLGSTWIPSKYIDEFINYLFEPNWVVKEKVKSQYMHTTSQWNISNKSIDRSNLKVHNTFGTHRINGYKIIEDTLNLKDVRVYDYDVDKDGKKVQVLNKKETAIACSKQDLIKYEFEEWIWKDVDRREELKRIYNDKFNSIRNREFDGSHLKFNGMNPEIKLRKHQVNAVARILYGGNTLLAHEVGAGKTFTMVTAAMESKRLGLCNKSLIVVPNHLVEQFSSEFLQLYPSSNILVTTKKDFEKSNRKKFCSRISTGDYDAIIISHSQFEKIPMSVERQREILQEQIQNVVLGIHDLKNNNGEKFSIKQLEKTKKTLQVKLEKLNDTSKKDDVVTFEELGVDRIFVDEAHYYKNLFLYTKMRNVGGIAQVEAQKSSDLFMKCRYLDGLTGGKGIIFATGTPVSNSMVELYTMQRYLQYGELKNNQLEFFDSWASTFGQTITAIELSPEGNGYRAKTRFAKFFNLPELMSTFKEVADVQTSEMLQLPLPKVNYHTIVIQPSEIQKEMVQDISNRAEKVRNKMVTPDVDNMLKITNDGRKLALDQRLINELLPSDPNGKIATCAKNVYRVWEKHKAKRLTQLIFCDMSTPSKDKFNAYDEMKRELISKGIPEDEIEFIHTANTDIKKKELFSKVINGQVRVLMGSTPKMGAGTNVQKKLVALHDLDCPWRPSDLIQRIGRIDRQGNENEEVEVYRYVTEGTFDAYLFQLVENKQKFISQIMTSKTPVRFAEDIDESALSYAEIKALASGNPLILEKTELDTEVAKLKLLKQNYLTQKYDMENKVLKYYPVELKKYQNLLQNNKEDIEHLKRNIKTNDDKFQGMVLRGVSILDKEKAGEIILDICKNKNEPKLEPIGSYKGFEMNLEFNTTSRSFKLKLSNKLSYDVELGNDVFGNITRIDNVLSDIDDQEYYNIKIEEINKNMESANLEIEKPFKQENELKEKTQRLNEINKALDLSENDTVIMDNEEEKQEISQVCKKEFER